MSKIESSDAPVFLAREKAIAHWRRVRSCPAPRARSLGNSARRPLQPWDEPTGAQGYGHVDSNLSSCRIARKIDGRMTA
jgi:hypothetical protein